MASENSPPPADRMKKILVMIGFYAGIYVTLLIGRLLVWNLQGKQSFGCELSIVERKTRYMAMQITEL